MGKLLEGDTSIDESMLTGESEPLFKEIGAGVIGGSINGDGSVTVEIKKTGKDSFLSKVITLLRKHNQLNQRHKIWQTVLQHGLQ